MSGDHRETAAHLHLVHGISHTDQLIDSRPAEDQHEADHEARDCGHRHVELTLSGDLPEHEQDQVRAAVEAHQGTTRVAAVTFLLSATSPFCRIVASMHPDTEEATVGQAIFAALGAIGVEEAEIGAALEAGTAGVEEAMAAMRRTRGEPPR